MPYILRMDQCLIECGSPERVSTILRAERVTTQPYPLTFTAIHPWTDFDPISVHKSKRGMFLINNMTFLYFFCGVLPPTHHH